MLQNIHNVRDLGNKVIESSQRITKTKLLFRSATTSNSNRQDVETLLSTYNIQTILDLRGAPKQRAAGYGGNDSIFLDKIYTPVVCSKEDSEHSCKQNHNHQVRPRPRHREQLAYLNGTVKKKLSNRVHKIEVVIIMFCYGMLKMLSLPKYLLQFIPFLNKLYSFVLGKLKYGLIEKIVRRHGGFGVMYFIMCKYNPKSIKRGLDICANPQRQPVLFHCASGKDRTGITAALLLHSVGCTRQQIVEDYVLSHEWGISLTHMVGVMGLDKDEVPNMKESNENSEDGLSIVLGAPSVSMHTFLNLLVEEYGSIDEYLNDIGFNKKCREKLIENFTEPLKND